MAALFRFYLPVTLQEGCETDLPETVAHHAVRVLRLLPGDALTLFDGRGGEYAARLLAVDKKRVCVRVGALQATERESGLDLRLAQGISSGDRMDYTVQKAVELGVRAIQPLQCSRAKVRFEEERAAKRLEHWRQVVVSACEQCGRNRLPPVAPVQELMTWLDQGATGILLDPGAEQRLRDLPCPQGPVTLLAGPESGLSDAERAAAKRAGFVPVRLGPRVLRTETAAVAALAAMQALWGDF